MPITLEDLDVLDQAISESLNLMSRQEWLEHTVSFNAWLDEVYENYAYDKRFL